MISAVVVHYREPELLDRCLTSLADFDEVVVVDAASGDRRPRDVGLARLIEAPRNGGFGAGANLGIVATKGDIVLVLNPDTEVRAGAVKAISQSVERHPRLWVGGCRLVSGDDAGPQLRGRRCYT